MAIRRNNLKPGDLVSGDQWISSQPGRLSHTFGKEADDDRYCWTNTKESIATMAVPYLLIPPPPTFMCTAKSPFKLVRPLLASTPLSVLLG